MVNAGRLIYVVNYPIFFNSHRLALALRAREVGYDVIVISPRGEGVDVIKAAGLEWHEISFDPGGMNPWRDFTTIRDLVRLFRRLKPDVVHNITIKPVLYGTFAARLTGVKRVVNAVSGLGYLFTSGRPLQRMLGACLYRLFLRHSDMRTILQNREDFALFESMRLAPPESLRLIRGSGVDIMAFTPAARPQGPPIILQTSRMVGDKGVREFIEAAKIVKETWPGARFVLVGPLYPGNPTAFTAEELRALEAQGAVEWWGPRDDVAAVLRQATIYCLPSYREGLPKSLLEAGACGLPLITTDTSGCKEVVADGENGLLVPVADGPALAHAIERLLDDPALAGRLAGEARKRVVRDFSFDTIAQAQIALYSELPLKR
jgi:glycosyltransferase involved in cell wall biosynthesis